MWKCVQGVEWLKACMIKTDLRQKQFSLYSCKSISVCRNESLLPESFKFDGFPFTLYKKEN